MQTSLVQWRLTRIAHVPKCLPCLSCDSTFAHLQRVLPLALAAAFRPSGRHLVCLHLNWTPCFRRAALHESGCLITFAGTVLLLSLQSLFILTLPLCPPKELRANLEQSLGPLEFIGNCQQTAPCPPCFAEIQRLMNVAHFTLPGPLSSAATT